MKTAIYVRTAQENEMEIEAQIELCKDLLDGEEFIVYADNGYSAHDQSRPAFKNMIKDIENGTVNKVIVYSIDRISRNFKSFYSFTDSLCRYGVTFISVIESLDSSSWNGNNFLNYLCILSENVENREWRGANGNCNLCSTIC